MPRVRGSFRSIASTAFRHAASVLTGSSFHQSGYAPGWSSWLNMAAEVGIVALPVGLLMIAGELDISVGAVLPASASR